MRLMARVEGMPLAALESGLSWDWAGIRRLVRAGSKDAIGVNAGFLVGHSAIRRVVMGERCHEPAMPAEVEAMAALVAEACAAGAIGFSTSHRPDPQRRSR